MAEGGSEVGHVDCRTVGGRSGGLFDEEDALATGGVELDHLIEVGEDDENNERSDNKIHMRDVYLGVIIRMIFVNLYRFDVGG